MPERPMITELKVSGHVMRLDPGLYCIFQRPGTGAPSAAGGLPGVRVSLPPGAPEGARAVEIAGFRADGWIAPGRDGALLRVNVGPAEILVTVYQAASAAGAAPHLEIVRIGETMSGGAEGNLAPSVAPVPATPPAPGVLAHLQATGDVLVPFGSWVGARGSRRWIEGIALIPPAGLAGTDLEYRAVLGHDWETPWARGGEFCGSRRMALPIRGLTIRLSADATARFECAYLASFIDGTRVGPLAPGECCRAASLAPLEALEVVLRPRPRAVASGPSAPGLSAPSARGGRRRATRAA